MIKHRNELERLQSVTEALETLLGKEAVIRQASMKAHTSFRIGGPADVLITPRSLEEIVQTYAILKRGQVPVTLMGNGSNMLVSDAGISGAVVKISDTFKAIKRQGTTLVAEAGALLSTLANMALAEGLGGFEWASGIPGTVGGAIFMNAGAYGGEMKDVVSAVTVLTPDGQVIRLDKEELDFGYRTSSVDKNGYVVLGVEIDLEEKPVDEIKALMDDLNAKRTSKQPLNLPSAGSTFKRPEGYYAGKLIEDAGLRGLRFGDAMVSDLHCGFVVNVGEASCEQVLTLVRTIQKIVLDIHGVALHPEIRLVGV